MAAGNLAIILHAHLPYVHHPEHEGFFEERWLYEAVSESYIPLLSVLDRLKREHTNARLTISFSPPLLHMLSDETLRRRYKTHLEKQLRLIENELGRTKGSDFHGIVTFYKERYLEIADTFINEYKCSLIDVLADMANEGRYEFITSAATHAFLPFIANRAAVDAQVKLGIEACVRYLGVRPRGIWLPECGYIESVEPVLKDNGIEYFFLDSHGLLLADPKPVYATYAPIVTPNGLVVFARDAELSRQVWSASSGYPGDPSYREFYRDIGYDLDYEYIRDHIEPGGGRSDTGLKYYRVTGGTGPKMPYDPAAALSKAAEHASHFLEGLQARSENIASAIGKPPLLVCPFDAELFGHWWFEGPDWLYNVLKGADAADIALVKPGEHIDANPVMQMAVPSPSTWGQKGYNEVWLNDSNDWIYRHLHKAAERMTMLADSNKEASGIRLRALNQAARELLLAQSSDWAFIMKAGTLVEYAEKRIATHIRRFTHLFTGLCEDSTDEEMLAQAEREDKIFPDMDYRIYSSIVDSRRLREI